MATFFLGAGQMASGEAVLATSKPLPPYARTTYAEPIGKHEAILWGFVNARRSETTVQFEIGRTKSYGQTVPPTPLIEQFFFQDEPVEVEQVVDHLRRDTTYHYRIVATSAGGTTYGKDKTFRTLPK